jgi:mannose-6-phosphate isomerase-like protein (cupin superfamily)
MSDDASGREVKAKVVPAGSGEHLALGPSEVHVLVGSEDTGQRAVLVEEHLPPGPGSPPPHVHHQMDHTFYVTGGTVEFSAGVHTVAVAAGGAVFVPRGTPHTFRNPSTYEDASFLEFDSPGNFDSYFRELSALLGQKGFDVALIRELQARYDTWPPMGL